jgi:protein associated with RNAse G/E
MKLSAGMNVPIHSYKHNRILHRIWKNTVVLDENQHVLVTGHKKTRVIEDDGRCWYTKEPAICYFYSEAWYNIIGMLKKDGVHFYCNLSSPYLYDGEAIKYIDYDLDVKVFPNGKIVILDEKEYRVHLKKMNYPKDIQDIVENEMQLLISKIKRKEKPFDLSDIYLYYEKYKTLTKK